MSTTTFPLAAAQVERQGGASVPVRRAAGDPLWVRPAIAFTTLATLVLYLWGLDRNGWANTYYAAAVQAGTQSWKAFFFGSLDAGNFITVDKPPASLWLMELSARIFGLSSWSMLAPEAIAGALTVLVLSFAVKRTFGPVAGLIAAAAMALTPVAVVMFRYNNPDALLTLLLVASAWAAIRALDGGRLRWLLLSAAIVGLAFNTKDLQAYIVLPALVITYFLFAPGGLGRRFLQLLAAGAVLVGSSGWWLAIVDAIPAAARPYVGGSTNNTVLDLVLGYNGLGRIFGQGGPAGGGRTIGGGAGFGGATGLFRLFSNEIGGQIAWLIPLAALSLVLGLWVYRSRPRVDLARAGYVLWGFWLATHFAVFSFASGIFHPYYTVALAPGVAALVGAGLVEMWVLRGRSALGALVLGAAVAGTGWWGSQLLARTPSFMVGLGWLELALAVAAAVVIVATRLPFLRVVPSRVPQVALAVAVLAIMLGPAAYAFDTVTNSSAGAIPSAGPATAAAPGAGFKNGFSGPPAGVSANLPAGARLPGGIAGIRGVGASLGADAIAYLKQHQGNATWLVAVQSANEAASIELSTGRPVLAMGGFSGSDPAMTVDKLAQLVSSGQLRYVLLSGGGPGGGSSSAVQQWIVAHGTAVPVGGTTLYDLAPSGS